MKEDNDVSREYNMQVSAASFLNVMRHEGGELPELKLPPTICLAQVLG